MNISGYSDINTHDGNTTILGDLVVKGSIFDQAGAEGIPEVKVENHSNLTVDCGTFSGTGGVFNIIDKGYILKKNGNWRIMSGRVDCTLSGQGYAVFTVRFDTPSGDTIANAVNIFMNGGISQNFGGNSPNFLNINCAVISGIINVTFSTTDKALWPQGVSVFTSARYCLSYLTIQNDPNQNILEAVPSYVENPMLEQLDANTFNIINVGNIQADTYNGGLILTNPLTADFNANSNNISNVNDLDAGLIEVNNLYAKAPNTTINVFNDLTFDENNIYQLSSITNGGVAFTLNAPNINITGSTTYNNNINMNSNNITGAQEVKSDVLYTDIISHLISPNDILFADSVNLQTNDLKNVGTLSSVNTITLNPSGGGIDMNSKDIAMDGGSINGANTIKTVNIQNSLINDPVNFLSDIVTNNKSIDLNGSFIDNCSLIANLGNIDIKTITSPITIAPTTSGNVEISTPSGNATLKTVSGNLNIVSGTSSMIMNNTKIETFAKRLEESTSSSNKVDTVHIYDASGFTETVLTIFGNDYYDLLANVTYIIHNQITVSNGFNFNVNTSIKGTSSSASITFDESTKNIIGFRAVDQNLIIQDITIIGGGGHFDNTNVGLIQGSNFNTASPAPFYGRNKRCLISGCNIVAPYSLGKLQGFGTTNILSNLLMVAGQFLLVYTQLLVWIFLMV